MRESVGAALLPFMRTWLDGAARAARAELGPQRHDRAVQAGQSMSGRDAIAAALRSVGDVPVPAV
jgi:hypothetical protein